MPYFELKKAEEKRPFLSALSYREKKGKETSPGYSCNPLSPRVRARGGKLACVCAYEESARRALQLCDILGLGTSNARFESSFRLWGFYCRHFDWWRISEKAYELASRQRQGEIRDAVTSFQKWLGKNFPKKVAASFGS